jgi:hypothetical protein
LESISTQNDRCDTTFASSLLKALRYALTQLDFHFPRSSKPANTVEVSRTSSLLGDISPSATRADQMPIVELHNNDLADPWSAENKLHPKQSITTGFLFYKLMDRLSSTSSFDSSAFPHRPKPGIHHDRHNKVGRDSKTSKSYRRAFRQSGKW